MLTIVVGPSGAGKTELGKVLAEKFGYKEIVSFTTRAPREGEKDGVDYHFVDDATFRRMISEKAFAEYAEYSGNRLYGSAMSDIKDAVESSKPYVFVATPQGMRAVLAVMDKKNVTTVAVQADLGTRVTRYINRCGISKFDFDDMAEISARVNRDFGMFLGIENEVDVCVENNGSDMRNLYNVAGKVHRAVTLKDFHDFNAQELVEDDPER